MTENSTIANASIDRRRVIQGVAWATPAVLLATGAPSLAASGEVEVPVNPVTTASGWQTVSGSTVTNWSPGVRTTGWLPAAAANIDHVTENFGTFTNGFQSGNDNASATAPALIQADYVFTAGANATYAVPIELAAQYGQGGNDRSSRQSVVISAIQDGVETVLHKVSVRHQNDNAPTPRRCPPAAPPTRPWLRMGTRWSGPRTGPAPTRRSCSTRRRRRAPWCCDTRTRSSRSAP